MDKKKWLKFIKDGQQYSIDCGVRPNIKEFLNSMIDYEAFAKAILEYDYCSYDLDGFIIQELGVKHGLLVEVETHGVCTDTEACNCLIIIGEIPDTCFKATY